MNFKEKYQNYIDELETAQLLDSKYGFVTFKIQNEVCNIIDIYINPEYRKKGFASSLADEVFSIAKEAKCKQVHGQVYLNSNYPEKSLIAPLKYGFKIHDASNGVIRYYKEC